MTTTGAVHARPSRLRTRLPRFMRTTAGCIGVALAAFVLAVALVGPYMAPHPLDEPIGAPGAGPSSSAALGTDFLGRDVLSRLLYGGRSLVAVAGLAVVATYIVGVSAGLLAGFRRGWIETVAMRSVDVLMSFPPLLLLLVVIVGAGTSQPTIVIGIVAVLAAPLARVVYSATLEATGASYVEAARIRGERTSSLLAREILPNIIPYVLASFGAYVSGAIIFAASLSFLGLGPQPPAADWGLMIFENQQVLATNIWAVLAPAIMIGLITIGVNLIGDAYARVHGISDAG